MLPASRSTVARRGRHPPGTRGRHVGAPLNPHPYILEEADAVGAQFLRDKLARKLGLICRSAFGLLLRVQKFTPPPVETVGNSRLCEPQALRASGSQAATSRRDSTPLRPKAGPPNVRAAPDLRIDDRAAVAPPRPTCAAAARSPLGRRQSVGNRHAREAGGFPAGVRLAGIEPGC